MTELARSRARNGPVVARIPRRRLVDHAFRLSRALTALSPSPFSPSLRQVTKANPTLGESSLVRVTAAIYNDDGENAVLMITELFGIDVRINRPGTSGGENWRFRVPWTVPQVEADPRLQDICRKLAAAISITRRTP